MSGTKTADSTGTPPVGRKLVAVVYADMVGYSRLIGLDDAGTLERLRTLRRDVIDPASAEHGGRIVNTGGDSLLIVFDSIDGAVRCGVRLQHEIPIRGGDQHLIEQQRCKPSAPQTMSTSHNWCVIICMTGSVSRSRDLGCSICRTSDGRSRHSCQVPTSPRLRRALTSQSRSFTLPDKASIA